ncbi:AlpA family phage regulatory protein [uncultured Shimia sp.]|uniref:helix-turn-helix transcriptional regulator n=1 Tax=uncultured Shimia sp. TaxID=573152 RepID=UPI00260DCFCC|nr:AlpA family phage regulatory protein [uncultured Shimia sp.]
MQKAVPMLRMPRVLELTGLSRPVLYRLVKKGKFPKPKQVSPNVIAWPESVIAEWQANLPESTIKSCNPKVGAV